MVWFLPLIGYFLGGFAVGATIGYLLDKYSNAKYAEVTKKRLGGKIKKNFKSGSFMRDNSLGLDMEDRNKNYLGHEDLNPNSFDEETRDFFSELEDGDIIDLETWEVYRNVG